jgi:hypothetical protein
MSTPSRLLIALAGACLTAVGCGSTGADGSSTVPPRDIIEAVAGALRPDAPLSLDADITTDGANQIPVRATFAFTMNTTGLHLVLSNWKTAAADPEVREIIVTEAGQYLRDPGATWAHDPSMTLHITRTSLAELARSGAEANRARAQLIDTLVAGAPTVAIETSAGEHCVRGPLTLPTQQDAWWTGVTSATIDFCVMRDAGGSLMPTHASLTYTAGKGVAGEISAAIDPNPPTIAAPATAATDRERASAIGNDMVRVGAEAVMGPIMGMPGFAAGEGTGGAGGAIVTP